MKCHSWVSFLFLLNILCFSEAFAPRSFVSHIPASPPATSSTALMGIKGFRSWFESQFPNAILSMYGEGSNDSFDHVLVDMNQLLHVCVRKSRSDGHGLTILLKELDKVVDLATPTQSLVLAMDGPPSAAKLATQRQRRYGTIVRSEWKLKNLERLGSRIKPKQLARKRRRAQADLRTLQITPGTTFMEKAENAILYWAWQRLSNAKSTLAKNHVKIFISSSMVPGEGEVKLLEWIYNRPRKGSSVCILGGDSDLVLEGLVIPPASTHNVFILLPDGSKKYLSVSLWETTRRLHKYLPHLVVDNIMKVRTDLVLLLILNGNDYLPKLRGSSGFNKLFNTYLRLHREWEAEGRGDKAFMIEPDKLEFNLPFTLAFFKRLAAFAPANLWDRDGITRNSPTGATSLQHLNNLAESGFLPKPINFEVIRDDDDDDELPIGESDDDEGADSSDNDSATEADEETVLVRLLLGEPGTEDFCSYEVWHPKGENLKAARQELSSMALADLIGEECEEDIDDDGLLGITATGYEWEITRAVDAKVDTYLYGLFWCLQTYQDGMCADYAYNYGKRLSPTANDIVDYLEASFSKGGSIGLRTLTDVTHTPPINAGLSCLAALPSAVKESVPEPYSLLDDEVVERIYASCMHPEDNYFDMINFGERCDEEVAKLSLDSGARTDISSESEGLADNYWTVVSKAHRPLPHPFMPPPPFSDRLSKLKPNSRIRINRIATIEGPRPRSVWGDVVGKEGDRFDEPAKVDRTPREIVHSDLGPVLANNSLENVPFRSVYRMRPSRATRIKGQKERSRRSTTETEPQQTIPSKKTGKKALRTSESKKTSVAVSKDTVDIPGRMKVFRVLAPSARFATTPDGLTAMACLKQLADSGFVGEMKYTSCFPSQSAYAAFDPETHEHTTLRVKPGSPTESLLEQDAVVGQDRDMNDTSRKTMKQHLAMLVMDSMFHPSGQKWSRLTFHELKSLASALSVARTSSVEEKESLF